MEVSVLTLVRDRLDHLANLLTGLRRSQPPPCELIVAWMGGADPRPVLAGEDRFPAKVIEVTGTELPLARARNQLAKAAEGELLVFLDVDCVPGSSLLGAHAAVLGQADALALGPVRYLPAEADAAAAEQALDAIAVTHPDRERLFGSSVRFDRRHELFWSLNFGTRRATFLARIDGFDEGYRGYGIEDTDFAFRARAAAVPLAWVPGAVAYHQHHPPTRRRAGEVPSLVRNARRFQRTWGTWPASGWLSELSSVGLVRWDEERDELEALV